MKVWLEDLYLINESKEDQERFINKFGKDSFDDFQKLKQRIKNKGYSPDLTFHVKNTSIEDMKKILSDVSDASREQEVDIEGKQIPKDTKNYKIIDKTSEWTIYQPLDYIASIYCAHGARWCTAGGYDVPEGKVKVSQAKQYFNEYADEGVVLYYCVNNKNTKKSLALVTHPNIDTIQYFNYNDKEITVQEVPKSLYKLLKDINILPPDFVIKDGVLKKYNGADKNVTIPSGVTSIGNEAFYECTPLESVTIPDSVLSIGQYAFARCASLSSVTISDSVTSISNDAFYECTSLESVTIPDSVTSIGNYAFQNCTSLTSISIPDTVTSIGYATFSGCSSLTNITIPDSVTSIYNGAFYVCTSLTNITIPDSVTSIGNNAFALCTSLTSITIPDSVYEMGDMVFHLCKSLTVHTKNPYVINYCEENSIKYDTNIKESINKNTLKLRIREDAPKFKLILNNNDYTPVQEDSYSIELLDGSFSVGEYVTVKTSDGKIYKRRVYDSPDDLYIKINGYKYYYSDLI